MNRVISQALRFKRSVPLGLLVLVVLAVLGSVEISAGIQGSGKALIAVGTVTDVGDGITVGDTTYSTSGAVFQIDGKPGKKLQLRSGDVISLWGSDQGNQSFAAEVTFNGNALGPVTSVDSGGFMLLGQTVRVSSDTIFGPTIGSLNALQNGQVVEVSAFADSAGVLMATRVDIPTADGTPQVVGPTQALDLTRQTFRINSLTINYSAAQVEGTLTEGSVVAARGTQFGSDGTLLASQVEVLPSASGPPGTDGRIDGIITGFSSSDYFAVNGQPVAVVSSTKLHLKQPLGLDVEVKVTGTFDANGVLVASRVQTFK